MGVLNDFRVIAWVIAGNTDAAQTLLGGQQLAER